MLFLYLGDCFAVFVDLGSWDMVGIVWFVYVRRLINFTIFLNEVLLFVFSLWVCTSNLVLSELFARTKFLIFVHGATRRPNYPNLNLSSEYIYISVYRSKCSKKYSSKVFFSIMDRSETGFHFEIVEQSSYVRLTPPVHWYTEAWNSLWVYTLYKVSIFQLIRHRNRYATGTYWCIWAP